MSDKPDRCPLCVDIPECRDKPLLNEDGACYYCLTPQRVWPAVQAMKDENERLKEMIEQERIVLNGRLMEENQSLRERVAELEAANVKLAQSLDENWVTHQQVVAARTENQRLTGELLNARTALAKKTQAAPTGCPTPGACSCPGADDGETVTVEWLLLVGFKENAYQNGYDSPLSKDRISVHVHDHSVFVCIGAEHQMDHTYIRVRSREDVTCGDVRNLCKALGVSLDGEK